MLQQSYQNLNGFLCAFVDQSVAGHQYFIRNRLFLEKLLGHEFHFRAPSVRANYDESLFLIGETTPKRKKKKRDERVPSLDQERTFTELFFYGKERALFFWNLSTFLFVDVLSKNFILAAIVTYCLNRVTMKNERSFVEGEELYSLCGLGRRVTTRLVWSSKFVEKNVNSKEFSHLIRIGFERLHLDERVDQIDQLFPLFTFDFQIHLSKT